MIPELFFLMILSNKKQELNKNLKISDQQPHRTRTMTPHNVAGALNTSSEVCSTLIGHL